LGVTNGNDKIWTSVTHEIFVDIEEWQSTAVAGKKRFSRALMIAGCDGEQGPFEQVKEASL
jgi:hypothetical protein